MYASLIYRRRRRYHLELIYRVQTLASLSDGASFLYRFQAIEIASSFYWIKVIVLNVIVIDKRH